MLREQGHYFELFCLRSLCVEKLVLSDGVLVLCLHGNTNLFTSCSLTAKAKSTELQISSVKFEDVGGNDATLKVSASSFHGMHILLNIYTSKANILSIGALLACMFVCPLPATLRG